MGPEELRKRAIEERRSAAEKINWFKRPICVLLGHAYVEHHRRISWCADGAEGSSRSVGLTSSNVRDAPTLDEFRCALSEQGWRELALYPGFGFGSWLIKIESDLRVSYKAAPAGVDVGTTGRPWARRRTSATGSSRSTSAARTGRRSRRATFATDAPIHKMEPAVERGNFSSASVAGQPRRAHSTRAGASPCPPGLPNASL